MKDMNLPGHEIYKEQATNIIQQIHERHESTWS